MLVAIQDLVLRCHPDSDVVLAQMQMSDTITSASQRAIDGLTSQTKHIKTPYITVYIP